LQFTLAGASNTIHREFQPDETTRLPWSEVAPATSGPAIKNPTPITVEPTPEEREAQDWARVSDVKDPAVVRGFLAVHPNEAHHIQAQALLDKLTAPPPAPDERPAIRAVLDEYLRSVQTKDENALRAAWPQIPSSEMDKWKTDFQNTKEIRIQPLNQPNYDITGNSARVDWRLQTEKSYPSTPTPYMGERNTRFNLRKDNGRWVIQSVR
jgi:hypothetical protein